MKHMIRHAAKKILGSATLTFSGTDTCWSQNPDDDGPAILIVNVGVFESLIARSR
jgi:hypothetical protein